MTDAGAVAEDARRAEADHGGVKARDRESYDAVYRSAPAVRSGRPSRQVVVEASGLAAGTALDAGCGEGADASGSPSAGGE